MKKKFLIFLLGLTSTVCLCIGLAACGNSDNKDSSGNLVYTLNDNGTYTVTADGNIAGELVIPSTYNDIAVTEIGNEAFINCASLTSITIPDSVTSIGGNAFYDCTSLTSITIPDSVTSIGEAAFGLCTSLTSITIPDGITSIGDLTFVSCTSLTSITIPDSVTSIGSRAFSSCPAEIIWGDNPAITEIGSYAFAHYEGASITIPESVTSIGNFAFEYCTALTEIHFNATAMDDLSSYNCVFYWAGQNSNGITVTIGANVTKIPAYLFLPDYTYAPNIISVVFEEGSVCTNIGEYAFGYCTSLKSATIGESVTSIDNYAFYDCTALTVINFNATAMDDLSINNCVFYRAGQSGDGITVTIGANVTKMPAYLFNPYTSSSYASDFAPKITSVVFEDGSVCTSIGSYAFYYCTSLTSVYYSGTASQWASISFGDYSANPLNYAGDLYLNGELATDITLESITTINAYAFHGCTSLENVTIGSGVTSICNEAFYNCPSIESVTIGSSVESIGSNTFAWCTSLTSVTIGNSVETIGYYAFGACSSLVSITLPFIGYSTENTNYTNFGYIFGASSYRYNSSYVPTSLKTVVVTGDTSIDSYAFYGCTSLTSVTICESVTSIGDSAFGGCSGLVVSHCRLLAQAQTLSLRQVQHYSVTFSERIVILTALQ